MTLILKRCSASAPFLVLVSMLLAIGLSSARAAEANTIYMDETFISGNQELPKVLYILPWKDQQGEAVPAMDPGLADRGLLTPIYPHEYRREMSFRAITNDQPDDSQNGTIVQTPSRPQEN